MTPTEITPWPHQALGREQAHMLLKYVPRVLVVAPTGGGKTMMMRWDIEDWTAKGKKVVLYTHRKMLLNQTSGVMSGFGVDHGIRAAGHAPSFLRNVQISSIWTEHARRNEEGWDLHNADYVLVDEAHSMNFESAHKVYKYHLDAGAKILGYTATPVGLKNAYDHIAVAGVKSELRACGALLEAQVFAPDEPSSKGMVRNENGDFSPKDVTGRMMVKTIFGRVYEHWKRLNQFARPTILFAPGVPESRWFVEQFKRRGITAAHIDAGTSDQERADIMGGSEDGTIKVICNRFVLREGVDAPWLYHCVMATMFGSLTGYLQSGGRLLRNHPSLEEVILQDHGGNPWRHGDINADRTWTLDDTNKSIARERKKALEAGEPEQLRCPQCSAIRWPQDDSCWECGHVHKQNSRMVVQTDGSLVKVRGRVVKKKRPKTPCDHWRAVLWVGAKKDLPLFVCRKIYEKKHGPLDPMDVAIYIPGEDSDEWRDGCRKVYPWLGRSK
jgi:DNA repair protein RadD